MCKIIKLRRGLDMNLKGGLSAGSPVTETKASLVAVIPDDFPGFVPKLSVHEGDEVECGSELLHDKNCEEIKLVSPVSGKVKEIVRGERRKILRVTVEADSAGNKSKAFTVTGIDKKENLTEVLMKSGLWAMMRQRPYDIIPSPGTTPVNIFISAFDSSPLAPTLADSVKGKEREIAEGIRALARLTSGKVYVSTRQGEECPLPEEATHIIIEGPHPAGNAGVQAANIAPVNKGETIWTLDIITAARIGTLLTSGKTDWSTEVALVGSDVEAPKTVKTAVGCRIKDIVKDDIKTSDHHLRIISGNVLTGTAETADGFLHYPYRQVTVIPEGDDVDEFMGWASMSPEKMSVSRSFLSSFMKKKKFAPDARLHGGRRAMIMSEQYDKVMPMDILPEYLVKAILAKDIDQMEKLGIYEVAPEDFALCEYIDPSKLELQKIAREGLDYLRKELE